MSASLVGSEMCIRDRPLQGSPAPQAHQATGLLWRPLGVLSEHTVFPVSYTHLTLPTICSV
eukprot:11593753-Alexandrium_andersonii.AAC.1